MTRTRLTVIIGVVVLLVIAAVSWLVVLSPRLSRASEIDTEAQQLADSTLLLRNQYNRSLHQAKQAPVEALQAQRLFSKMPQQADLPAVIEQIQSAADQAGIDIRADLEDVSTGVPAAVPMPAGATDVTGIQLATMAISIRASGTEQQVLDFIDNLQQLDRALLVKGTQTALTTNGARTDASVNFSGTMFVLQSKLPDLVAAVEDMLNSSGAAISAAP